MTRLAIFLAVLASACVHATPAMAADIAAPGNGLVVDTLTVDFAGSPQRVDIYRPALEEPAGAAIVAHGFGRSRSRHRDLARALAEAGILAIVPDLPSVVDLAGNGRALATFVASLEAGEVPGVAIARDRLVLIGTSAGGLASLVAAERLPGIAGWIGLDPVDRTGTATHAAGRMHSPAIVMLAEPSLCNLMTSGRSIAQALAQRVRTLDVSDASHCDFEDPTNHFCEAVCGRSTEETRLQIRHETVTATKELLEGAAP